MSRTEGKIELKNSEHGASIRGYSENDDPQTCFAVFNISTSSPRSIANANHIISLWNLNEEYDLSKVGELVEALEELSNAIVSQPRDSKRISLAHEEAKTLIAKVKGEKNE